MQHLASRANRSVWLCSAGQRRRRGFASRLWPALWPRASFRRRPCRRPRSPPGRHRPRSPRRIAWHRAESTPDETAQPGRSLAPSPRPCGRRPGPRPCARPSPTRRQGRTEGRDCPPAAVFWSIPRWNTLAASAARPIVEQPRPQTDQHARRPLAAAALIARLEELAGQVVLLGVQRQQSDGQPLSVVELGGGGGEPFPGSRDNFPQKPRIGGDRLLVRLDGFRRFAGDALLDRLAERRPTGRRRCAAFAPARSALRRRRSPEAFRATRGRAIPPCRTLPRGGIDSARKQPSGTFVGSAARSFSSRATNSFSLPSLFSSLANNS